MFPDIKNYLSYFIDNSHTSTLPHFHTSTLQHFNTSTLQHFNTLTLQHFNTLTLQKFNTTTLQHFNTLTLKHFKTSSFKTSKHGNWKSSKLQNWKTPKLHITPWIKTKTFNNLIFYYFSQKNVCYILFKYQRIPLCIRIFHIALLWRLVCVICVGRKYTILFY